MKKSDIEIVIPLGITYMSNGEQMPRIDFLEFGLSLLKEQTIPVKITIAVDENIQKDRLQIIEKYADKIKWFPIDSYFRPSGIWLKIWQCWEESDCKYVAWSGYDDYSDRNRFEYQKYILDITNKHACFCSNYWNKDGLVKKHNDGYINFYNTIGKHCEFMGGFLLNREMILNSGIDKYKHIWSYYFEGLLNLFILKLGTPEIASNSKFYYREHHGTISETVTKDKSWVIQAQNNTNYTMEQCKLDWDSVHFEELCEDLRQNII